MLQNKTVLKILSLMIAIFLWMYVIGQINPKTTVTIRNIPVQLLNEQILTQNNLALKEDDEFTTVIVVEGQRADLNRLDKSEIKATADLKGLMEGNHTVAVEVKVPDNLTLAKIKTSTIEVDLEKIVSVSKPVRVSFSGEAQEGMEGSAMEYQPEEIDVEGPQSKVNAVANIKAEIDIKKLTGEQQSLKVKPVPVDEEGNEISNVRLSQDAVSVQAALYYTKAVPLKTETKGKLPQGYELTDVTAPDTITIVGPRDKVDRIKSVKARAIDLSKLKTSAELEIETDLPAQVKIADKSTSDKIKVSIQKLSAKKVKLSSQAIQFQNLAEGLTAKSEAQSFLVSVSGSKEDIDSAVAEDFVLTADLKGYGQGEYTVSVTVKSNKEFETVKLENDIVKIIINEES